MQNSRLQRSDNTVQRKAAQGIFTKLNRKVQNSIVGAVEHSDEDFEEFSLQEQGIDLPPFRTAICTPKDSVALNCSIVLDVKNQSGFFACQEL